MLQGTVHRFNTGRLYGAKGQPIVWAIFRRDNGSEVVVFIDEARMIDGVIDLHFGNHDLVDDRWVLRAYDDHHYYSSNYTLVQQLRELAKRND